MTFRKVITPTALVLLLVAAPVGISLAQDDASEPVEDASFLERQIQNLLGGDGRTVVVSGLDGLLSSEAQIALIEISDDDGVWLTVRDVVLDWRRLALVRGRLEVNALTVGTVNLVRAPLPSPKEAPALAADPDAQPEPFALPDLPVSVNIAQLSVGGVRIGEPILGQQVDLSLSGNARLEDGEGGAELSVVRIDGQESAIGLNAGFENETRRLYVDLNVSEAANGLITSLAGIPGTPSLNLTLSGDAPISDFQAQLALKTDDQDRLNGTIGLAEEPNGDAAPNRLITADIGGDVADLFLPDYRDFFGNSITLALSARQGAEIGLDVEELRLETAGLHVTGTADLTPEFLPSAVNLDVVLGTQSGLPVVLPLPGPGMLVHRADLTLTYDETQGDSFKLDLQGDGIMRTDGLLLDHVAVTADGALVRSDPTNLQSVTAQISGAVSGFSTTNPALWDAVGDDIDLNTQVVWENGGALDLTGFSLLASDISANGDATVTGLQESAAKLAASFSATVPELDRFSAISGQSLGGAINAKLTAEFDTVSGAGSVDLTGKTNDLSVGDPQADGLLTGPVDLAVTAARTSTGISVDKIMLDGERIELNGAADIAPDFWPRKADLTARIGNPKGGVVSLPIPGQEGDLQSADLALSYDERQGDEFDLKLDAQGFRLKDMVSVGTLNLALDGALQRQDSTVKSASLTLSGDMGDINAPDPKLADVLADGLRLAGDLDWTAEGGLLNVSGFDLSSGEVRAALDAALTGVGADDMAASAEFDVHTGPLSRFAGLVGMPLTGTLNASGNGAYALDTGFFNVDAKADGADLRTGQVELDALLAGTPRIVAKAKLDENGLRVDQAIVETDEVNLTANGTIVDEVLKIRLDGALRELGIFVDGFNGPVTLSADATNGDGIWGVDGKVTGPGGAGATFKGDALRPDGTMDLAAAGSLPLGLANQFIVPRSINGDLGFDVKVSGKPSLEAVSGTVSVAGARVADPATRLALENLGLNVQIANSKADLNVGGDLSSGGRIEVSGPITLTGNIPADITATLSNIHLEDPTLYDVNLEGRFGINGPLTGGAAITGRIDIGRSELKIPAGIGGGGSVPLVSHQNEPGSSHITRERAGLIVEDEADKSAGGGGPAYPLDIVISAPQEIFVRGRGLDVEMGGEIQIGGTTAAPLPTGSLQLIRGRLALLAQRLEFETAEISLQGDLDPDINMIASSDSGDVNAKIVIEGPATDPEISFTSEPELPEDEVLAQLFFGKPIQELSPLEIVQLGAAINTLTGGSGGLFGKIRDGIGVDDLSVSTDTDGNTSVSAGKYITERVYTDVTVGSDGTSQVELNYEIRKDFTARGSFDNEGSTGIGVTFERDY